MEKIIEVEDIGIDSKGRPYATYEGKKIYVKYAVPGDRLKISVTPVKKGRRGVEYWGDIVEIIEAGEGRVKPKCRYFGICGGCRFQNWDYNHQLKYKKKLVVEAFKRFSIEAEILDPIPSPRIWYYRNRMDYPVGWDGEKPVIGLKILGRWDLIVDLDECHLESRESVEIIKIVKDFMRKYDVKPYDLIRHKGFMRYVVVREGKYTGDRLVSLVTARGGFIGLDALIDMLKEYVTGIVWSINPKITDLSVGEEVIGVYGRDYLTEEIGGIKFHIHPNAFFQTNSYQANKLVQLAKRFSDGGDYLIDVYSGVGLFTYNLMDKYKKVLSIEVDPSSIYSAEVNKKWLRADNVNIVEARAEDWLKRILTKPDTVIVDPPRPGLSREVKDELMRIRPKEILYFSCNPETMARDIHILSEVFELDGPIIPIDMFPHTPHVEVFTRLVPR